MAQAFGEHFKIPKEKVYGMDIRPAESKMITFIECSATEFREELAAKFDLVTICMTLHHIAHYKQCLNNAARYLADGGILYVREHDARNNEIKLMLDVHDQIFNSALYEVPECDHKRFCENCRSWFLSR